MNPEERKAIAMRQPWHTRWPSAQCEHAYPDCCSYHEGFDAALALLEPVGWVGVAHEDEAGEWFFHYEDENADEPEYDKDGNHIGGYVEVRTVFAVPEA